MHFIAFTRKEWNLNSLGRYINSSRSKTCFVIRAMLAHMLRLIIQNRFHLLLKYFNIWNSLSDVPSAPLFVDSVSIFVAWAVEFEVGVLAPEDFSVSNLPLRGLTIRRSCVCCSVCMRNGLRFTDSKHYFADESCEFAARLDPHAVHVLPAGFARDEVINSFRSALLASLREELLYSVLERSLRAN